MKIKLLSSAKNDLAIGRSFYEKQGKGLGEYFFDSLFSDIDSLILYGGIHSKFSDYYRMLAKSHMPFITNLKGIHQLLYGESLIYGIILQKSSSP